MPVINDAVVVNSAYQTSASARPQKLSNGWIVSTVYDNINLKFKFYVSKDNFATSPTLLTEINYSSSSDLSFSVASYGTFLYIIFGRTSSDGYNRFAYFNALTTSSLITTSNVQTTSENSYNSFSHAINDAGTELHATWASKNSAYPNSFNIRYAKGTINSDGSVVWGAVEWATTGSYDYQNPSILLDGNGKFHIFTDYNGVNGTNKYNRVIVISNAYTEKVMSTNSNFGNKFVYQNDGYLQSSPSAIFVPQRINGLANGLMAVAWHGTDSTHTTTNYIRFSKATDGIGATWSSMKKLVPGTNATLTANKAGKLFITYEDAGVTKRIESTDNGDNWSTATTVGTGANPSSLFDLTMDMSAPLTIRKGTSSVLFSGSWTVTTNSVPSGDIGQKTSKDNLLTYAITTDGTMSTITEKVNGVTVGTKTATSGQSLTVSLTQAQWDAVRYGKYANTTGDRNTLTIEMGTEVWTYTFDKIPTVDAQITELLKSHIDSADVAIPANKALLGASIRGKGGAVNDADSLEVMASAIGGIPLGKKWASGTTTSANAVTLYQWAGSTTGANRSSLTVTGLAFKPSLIYAISSNNISLYTEISDGIYTKTVKTISFTTSSTSSGYATNNFKGDVLPSAVINGGFTIPVEAINTSHTWLAIE